MAARRTASPRPGAATLAFGVPLAALAYFLVAPALPALPAGDAATLVAGALGLIAIAATTLALVPARETLVGPLFIVLGAGLVVAALNAGGAGGVGAAANVPEALLAGAVGLLFARWLAAPAAAIAVPLFVAAVDAWSVATGPTSRMLADGTEHADPLSFDLPAWGGGASVGHLGLADAMFLALFAAWAWRYGFRRTATIVGMALGLLGALVLGVTLDRSLPALPLIAVGYLLPNLDRIGAALRQGSGRAS